MAHFEITYNSKEVKKAVTVNVFLPEKPKTDPEAGPPVGKFKTLWLFHGLNGNRDSWIQNTSIERYAIDHGIAVVMPEVDRSFYTDLPCGWNYFSFVAKELPAVLRSYFTGMSEKREDNFVIGQSMGGYGALKCALTFPENYFGVASLSGVTDITRKGRPYDLAEWRTLFGFDLNSAEDLAGSENDLFFLAEKQKEKPLPKIFLWCGTEDPLLPSNQAFHEHLVKLGIDHHYSESEGDHTWKWWDSKVQAALSYFLD